MDNKNLYSKIKKYGASAGLLFGLFLGGCDYNFHDKNNSSDAQTNKVTKTLPLEYSKRHPSIQALIKDRGVEYYPPSSFQTWTHSLVDICTGTGICSKDEYKRQRYRRVFIRLDGKLAGTVNSNTLPASIRGGQPRRFNETEWKQVDVRIKSGHDYVIPFNQGDKGYPFGFKCNGNILRIGIERYLRGDIRGEYGEYGEYNVDFYEASWGVYVENGFRKRGILPEEIFYIVNGMANVESNFLRSAENSSTGARGILQQMPKTLQDCGVPQSMHKDRLAQLDCAYRYFEDRFSHYEPLINNIKISSEQRNEFLLYLAVQAYHTGQGNIEKILKDPESIKIANRFVEEGRDPIEIVHGLTILNYGLGNNGTKVGLVSSSYLPKVIASVRILEEVRRKRRKEGNRIKGYSLPPLLFPEEEEGNK